MSKQLMTEQQEAHLKEVQDWVKDALDSKYRKGQAEHGGDVWRRPILPEIDGEVIDFLVYHVTLKRRVRFIQEGVAIVKQALQRGDLANALDILDSVDSNLRDL